MFITLEKNEFSDAVTKVARFAERRATSLPILSGIALIAGDDGIKVRAVNLETAVDIRVKGNIKNSGTTVIPATILKEIVNTFGGSNSLTIEQTGETITIITPEGRSTLKTLPYEDFPTLPIPDPKTKFSIEGALLKNLIGMVLPYTSPSTVRPELGSIYLCAEGGVLKAVATDSFRLAEKTHTLPGTLPQFTILIPSKNASDILQTLPDENIEVSVDEHQGAFSWQNGIVTTRLVTIPYPDYTQIIPKTNISEGVVLRKDFESALKRTSVFSDPFQKVKIHLDPKNKKIGFSARNTDVGESTEAIHATVQGEEVELSFNHRYLQAPLPTISTESIQISAAGIGRPLIIRGVGDATFLYLVMPMNQ
jgi:DNA polymerase-3 subunit beta